MQRETTTFFGVILEREPATSPWADWIWRVADVVTDAPETDGWMLMSEEGEGRVRYLNAPHPLTLHHKMVEAYDANIETGAPKLWVMLDDEPGAQPPFRVRGITADPYEAQGALDSAEGLVEKIEMPRATLAWMARFLSEIPEAPAFRKRRRDKVQIEKQIFGKDPVYTSLRHDPEEGQA